MEEESLSSVITATDAIEDALKKENMDVAVFDGKLHKSRPIF